MSLPGSPVSPGPRWAPTHVQVTVLQARGLRAKAKGGQGGSGGGSDAYAVMALGKEKFATSVAERCLGSPVWREEATFELPPPPRRGLAGGLGEGGAGAGPPAVLQLTVFHRALLGLDKFLGRAEISLAELQTEGGRRAKRWYKLHSKPGKKEKERGEIEVDIQFMRSNMTASLFDLSMKDKSRTPFGKLKDKLKGKRGNGLPDTASAIIPSINHSPADSEEESNEKEKKKSKFKTLFSKPGLQKNNLSQSMSVLPTLQPVSERVRLRPSDFQSKWGDDDDDDDDTLTPVSEKPSTNRTEANLLYPPPDKSHKRTGSGDSKQLNQMTGSNTKKDSHSLFGGLKSKNDPASRSNVCINGSHVYVESKGDTLPKDSTPSSPSSQTSQRKRLFLSQENLSLDPNKEPENAGRLPLDKVPPESSSLESFKAMTLPSYKLLSGGDLLESYTHTPVISDTLKETKETKKQENKKPGLLSIVTGKKEAKISEEREDTSDTSLKVKEEKRNEKELPKKETNPFEVPVDRKRGHGPEKSSGADVSNTKASLNPFNESMEEEQPEKSSFAVKPSQTKPVKPRLGVSSEDETKATLTLPVSSPASPLYLSYQSNSENNPFTYKGKAEQKSQDSDRFASLTNLSVPHYSNPFTTTWEEQSKEQVSNLSTVASLHHISPASGKENNPFSPHWRQESQTKDSEDIAEPPLYFQHPPATSVLDSHPFPSQLSDVNNPVVSEQGNDSESLNSAASSFNSTSLAPELYDSKLPHGVPSEKPQNEGVTSQTDPVSSSSGSVSNPAGLYERVETITKTLTDERVHIVPPFKENSGRMKKSVTFLLDEPKDNDVMSSDEEVLDEDQVERCSNDENEDVLKSAETDRRQRRELDVEPSSVSVAHDRRINSARNSEDVSESESKSGSLIKIEAPVPVPRISVPLPKETSKSGTESSSTSPSVPPKPAPRSALKLKDVCLPPTSVSEASDVSVFKELSSDSSISSGKLVSASSLTTSESTVFPFTREDSSMDPSQSFNNQPNHVISTQDLNIKSSSLPVIPEVGSDDEQLNNYHQNPEKMAGCGDSPRSDNDFGQKELASDAKAADEKQTVSFFVKANGRDDSLKPNESLVSPSGVILPNVRGLEQKSDTIVKENRRHDFPVFSDKPVPISSSSQSYSVSSFQSDGLGCNNTESLKTATTEGLDAKVEVSGQKKLLQAWVSPSETHPNQTLQSGGTYPPKFRLHPVKPMNATTNKPPAKTSNIATKIVDNQNAANLKKYDPSEPAYAYAQLTHDELIQLVLKQKDTIAKRDHQVRELEDYIDNLLVRVMEETPNILRIQAHANKKAGKM